MNTPASTPRPPDPDDALPGATCFVVSSTDDEGWTSLPVVFRDFLAAQSFAASLNVGLDPDRPGWSEVEEHELHDAPPQVVVSWWLSFPAGMARPAEDTLPTPRREVFVEGGFRFDQRPTEAVTVSADEHYVTVSGLDRDGLIAAALAEMDRASTPTRP